MKYGTFFYLYECKVVDIIGVQLPPQEPFEIRTIRTLLGPAVVRALPLNGLGYVKASDIERVAMQLDLPDSRISVEHAALRLGLSPTTVRRLLLRNMLIGYKVAGKWHVDAQSVWHHRYYKSGEPVKVE